MVPLQWSPWVSFDAASFSALPACPGVYRVRVVGHQTLPTDAPVQGNADGAGTQTAPILPHPLSYRPAMMSACSSSATSAPGAANAGLAGIASTLMPCFSVEALRGAQRLGQPKSGPCQRMGAASGCVSLGQMTNLDLRETPTEVCSGGKLRA
jgi:hypothetical protein